MLKWTVTRRIPPSESNALRPPTTDVYNNRRQTHDVVKIKCRRSSSSRRRSTSRKSCSPSINNKKALEYDKENCFTSTPIKSSENYHQYDALRDVSNLTPQDTNRIRSIKRCREQYNDKAGSYSGNNFLPKSPLSEKKKKKKLCLNNYHDQNVPLSSHKVEDLFERNYFKPFESVDSHIQGISSLEEFCGCNSNDKHKRTPAVNSGKQSFNYYAPTLPTFQVEDSPCFLPNNHSLDVINRKSCPSRLTLPLSTVSRYKSSETSFNDDFPPPKKKSKVDPEKNVLHPILFGSSASDTEIEKLDRIESKLYTPSKINVSPLVKRLIDLRFSKISYDGRRECREKERSNNSSYINNLSLDKIVDAILETTNENDNSDTKEISSGNTSMVVNLDPRLQERENELNETHEENLINSEHERQISVSTHSYDRNSFDSGFSSTSTKQYHDVGANFTCKCNNNNDKADRLDKIGAFKEDIRCDKTIIDLSDTFNERCVDSETKVTKKSCSPPLICNRSKSKRSYTDNFNENGLEDDFTLKRQKCIRRRRPSNFCESVKSKYCGSRFNKPEFKTAVIESIPSSSPVDFSSANKTQIHESISSFESSFVSDIPFNANEHFLTDSSSVNLEQTYTVNKTSRQVFQRRTRRCLSFEISNLDDKSPTPEGFSTPKSENEEVKGIMDLEMSFQKNQLIVKVLRCKDLNRAGLEGQINAYVKVILTDRIGDGRKKRNGILQRTAVQANSCRPTFNHTFRLPIHKQDISKRLHIEVWHRDRSCRRSDFLGCMSFTIKNVIKKEISGSYRLLPQSTGRCQNVPITKQNLGQSFASTINDSYIQAEDLIKMCDSQTTNEEIMSIDDFDADFKKTSNPALLNQHQKDADENLFLRYLELDPTEGPDAIPAALQRKATGNKNGRTPFTTTKKLIRPPKSGFGFSVVWTHPPRIERVEKGLPADRAGILPGDYIIFVDKHNIVTMPEVDILNLIKSYGIQLTLEIYRRNASRNGSTMSVRPAPNSSTLPAASFATQHRPSTVGSLNTASAECSRRRLNLPQVAFTAEKPITGPEEARKKAMFQLLAKEQHYSAALQFAVTRFVSALAERKDLITPADHRVLFQNSEEILRLTEDIMDCIIPDDGEPQLHLLLRTYQSRLSEITSSYKRYCSGIKKADCILVNKTRNSNSDFVRFLQTPAIPRRRPDITAFIHKPLEHYREVLKLFNVILSNTKPNYEDYPLISRIVQELQISYREMTAEAGLMEPVGEGRPLLTVQDLENRLVFTKCKPFVLSKPGRQWIFGGDLSRVEGRSVRQYWTLLFSDLLLFAKVSRDRVLFIIEDPLPLAHITELLFNVRKKATEFRLIIQPGGTLAKSPTVHCGPDLTRTPRKNANKRCVVLRAPTTELKAVWQNLLQRQIFQVNAGMDGSSFSSPLESPDAPITSSVGTLQSAESLSIRRQNPQCINQSETTDTQKQILDELIEHKCKQLGKCSSSTKGSAIHLEQWMKGQLGQGQAQTPEEESDCEVWTVEMLRKRTEELQLVEDGNSPRHTESRCEELVLSDQSPSKSTSPESQVTVRSSPIAPETVSVCKQCHKTCRTSSNSTNTNINSSNNNTDHSKCSVTESPRNVRCSSNTTNFHEHIHNETDRICDDFGRLMLLGLSAVNPAASLVKLDPFSPVPKISVVPPTPDTRSEFRYSESVSSKRSITQFNNNEFKEIDNSPDDSPQDEEQPYHSLSSSNPTLRRFGTVSSLERLGSEENEENNDTNATSSDSEEDDIGIDNQAFNHSMIRGWTARAGAFVSEKMAFFEKLGEDYRTGTGFFERYLKTAEVKGENGEDDDCENSGATSGEEIWGTPTSGEMEDPLSSSNYDGRRSPNGDSVSSDNGDETELMMDELLMTPPIASSNLRGLLPRRTLEPLMEEDSDTCTSSSSTPTEQTPSPKQGNGTGNVADTCLTAAGAPGKIRIQERSNTPAVASPAKSTTPRILRSDSYRHIIEAEDDNANFFNRFKSNSKIINVERIPRSRGVKLFEIFYVKKNERKIHETFPEGSHLIKIFNREGITSDDVPTSYSQKPLSPRKPKDKQMDGRFWRQLSRRRGNKKSNLPA